MMLLGPFFPRRAQLNSSRRECTTCENLATVGSLKLRITKTSLNVISFINGVRTKPSGANNGFLVNDEEKGSELQLSRPVLSVLLSNEAVHRYRLDSQMIALKDQTKEIELTPRTFWIGKCIGSGCV